MPRENCSIVGCSTSRKRKGISISKIPKAKSGVPEHMKWSEDLINVITRNRVIDGILKRKINESNRPHIREKYFKKEEIEHCKLILLFQVIC